MVEHYDLRVTIRNMSEPDIILKQYSGKDIPFPNQVATGDKVYLSDKCEYFNLVSEPVQVYHPLGQDTGSLIEADIKTFKEYLPEIKKFLEKYNCKKF